MFEQAELNMERTERQRGRERETSVNNIEWLLVHVLDILIQTQDGIFSLAVFFCRLHLPLLHSLNLCATTKKARATINLCACEIKQICSCVCFIAP